MKNYYKILAVLLIAFYSCDKKNDDRFPVDKPVWDIADYENVSREINYNIPEGEKLPTISDNPELFSKLLDTSALDKVLNDNSLGLTYRAEYSEKLFDMWKTLAEPYNIKDRQDKFVYPIELVKLRELGLYIQIKYFRLGNDKIIKESVDPEEFRVTNILNSNQDAIVSNFSQGISFLTNEDALTPEAISYYAKVVTIQYGELLKQFPGANYSAMQETITNILKKIKSQELKDSLNEINKIIDHNNKKSQDNANR